MGSPSQWLPVTHVATLSPKQGLHKTQALPLSSEAPKVVMQRKLKNPRPSGKLGIPRGGRAPERTVGLGQIGSRSLGYVANSASFCL